MPNANEDLELCIAAALSGITTAEKKAIGSGDWSAEERALKSVARKVRIELHLRYDFHPVDAIALHGSAPST